MDIMDWIWLVLLVFFSILEACTPQLVSIWFAAGSLIALIAALLNAPIWLQILLFVLSSLILVLCTRPLYRKYLAPKQVRTNIDALPGMIAPVTAEIDNLHETGSVKVKGLTWSARSADGRTIPAGSQVRIAAVDGVKLIVTPYPDSGGQSR